MGYSSIGVDTNVDIMLDLYIRKRVFKSYKIVSNFRLNTQYLMLDYTDINFGVGAHQCLGLDISIDETCQQIKQIC